MCREIWYIEITLFREICGFEDLIKISKRPEFLRSTNRFPLIVLFTWAFFVLKHPVLDISPAVRLTKEVCCSDKL